MIDNRLKYIFYGLALVLLLIMLKGGWDGGISGDEYLHYDQSDFVYDFFATHGKDISALNTPQTYLKYYGQSFDNLTTILIRWFKVEDIYLFRHLSNSFAGWLTVIVTAFFAIWLSGFGAGILVILLFAISPTFLGHAQNNLKDIPFALGYIASIFFIQRFLFNQNKPKNRDFILLIASIAFSISIRPGGLLLICYLFFFLFLYFLFQYISLFQIDKHFFRIRLLQSFLISITAWFFSVILWPYAQLNPILNVLKSYQVMTQYPITLQQVFEGRVEWSDFMPWYYLPKYMAITIPLIIFAGLAAFVVLSKQIVKKDKLLHYGFLVFSVLFPIIFVIYEKSNLYGSWRHFLFVYPSIVLLSAVGFSSLLNYLKNKYIISAAIFVTLFLAFHPAKFMILNHPYYYLYYNQLVGGLKGAYSNYETDYYYHTIREGSEWLVDYLKNNKQETHPRIAGNFPVAWYFRDQPDIRTFYCPYDERGQKDWDYMVVANSYIPVNQLTNGSWPPQNAIYMVYVDDVPVCTVLKRESKSDLQGYEALIRGDIPEAKANFAKAIKINTQDELTFYNFAATMVKEGKADSARYLLQSALTINPGYEPVLMYLGNIAVSQGKDSEAIGYYETLIGYNRKYFEAYVALSKLWREKDIVKARDLLKSCIRISPGYQPAIRALADTYRASNPEVAKKYDQLLNSNN